jgi:hypothetical protein
MTVLLEELEGLDAEAIQEDEKLAKSEAEWARPGITMFTDGSRLDDGPTGYAVVWQNGQPRSLRHRMCSPGKSPRGGDQTLNSTGTGHHLH